MLSARHEPGARCPGAARGAVRPRLLHRAAVRPQPHLDAHRALARGASGADEHCRTRRSEEHTSELQSLMRISYAVFCLKKRKCSTLQALIRIIATNRESERRPLTLRKYKV